MLSFLGKNLSRRVEGNPSRSKPADNALAAELFPAALVFERDCMRVDDRFRLAFGIREFSPLNGAGWGRRVLFSPKGIATILVEPSDKGSLARRANNVDARAGVALYQGTSAAKAVERQSERDHARALLEMMSDQKKAFVSCSFYVQVEADAKEELMEEYRSIQDDVRGQGMALYPCLMAQEEAYRLSLPTTPAKREGQGGALGYLPRQFSIDMPLDTLAATRPFSRTGFLDADGTDLGVDEDGSLVRADMLSTSLIRSNMNVVITGASGKGKSRTLKKIVLSEYAKKGARVIWIDPEGEGAHIAHALSGQYVNAGGASRASLCPLQPRAIAFGQEEEGQISVLRSTINFLRGFYQLAFNVDEEDFPYLDRGLTEAYAAHGLTFETPCEEVDFDDYPSMDEVARAFKGLCEREKDAAVARIYRSLSEKTATGGKDGLHGNLWSGKTNIDLKSDFVVFDIHGLIGGAVSDAAKNAQMYSILTFIWGQICKTRGEARPLRLVIDEGHMLFATGSDTEVGSKRETPVTAAFVSMMVKRARKYGVGVLFATQQISDMVGRSVREHGEALLANSAYHLIFGTEASDLDATVELCKLTEGHRSRISRFGRGDCILKSGAQGVFLHVEDTPAERAWIGTAGGV